MKTKVRFRTYLMLLFCVALLFLVWQKPDIVGVSPSRVYLMTFLSVICIIALLFTAFKQFECTEDKLIVRNLALGTKEEFPLAQIKEVTHTLKKKEGSLKQRYLEITYEVMTPDQKMVEVKKEWRTYFVKKADELVACLQKKTART